MCARRTVLIRWSRYNRLLLELDLTPKDVEIGEAEISINQLMKALCQMRFSSRCLALDDEVQKSMKIQGHLQNHASVLIAVVSSYLYAE